MCEIDLACDLLIGNNPQSVWVLSHFFKINLIFKKGRLKNVYFEEERMTFFYRHSFNNKKNKTLALVE